MGKVFVAARIENIIDAFAATQGTLSQAEVRAVEVPDALADLRHRPIDAQIVAGKAWA